MAGDADFDKVTLLLHGDGAHGATSIIDSSSFARSLVVYGDASISTSASKFGGSSIRTAAGGLYVSGSDDSLAMGSGDFTVECFVRPDSASAGALINNYGTTTFNSGFVLQSNGSGVLSAMLYSGGVVYAATTASGVLTAGSWQHLAAVRNGSSLVLWREGVSAASVSVGSAVMNSQKYPTRLGMESNTGAYSFSAYFDEVRITKGLARYTAGFTPPTDAFSVFAYQLAGTVVGDAGTPVARLIRAYREDTGAYVAEGMSDAVTGAFVIEVGYSGAYTLAAYPAGGESLPALVHHGVIPI